MGKFICKRCGKCCTWPGYVRLNTDEVETIATFLGMEAQHFTAGYTRLTADRRNLSLTEKADGSCIFYTAEPPGCAINPVKPRQCRDFPEYWNFPGWEHECGG
ncbi:MAG: YkgJ family cysteine cluster protein [Victivallales bacterium]|nr:YkgJ family cysteine cluster protein [Victivallales bacterium]